MTRTSRFRFFAALIASSALVGAPVPSQAQDYPARPIRLVVPFAPGGNTDVAGRLIAKGMGDLLGQQIVVDNRGGAGGSIGAEIAAKAPADGYTLLLASSALTINPSLYLKLPYDISKDFEPVGLAMTTSLVLVAAPGKGIRTMADLIAAAKARPGKLTYGSAGVGSGSHLTGELFNQVAKVDTLHVPYKGSGPATAAIVSGEVDFTFTSQAGALALFKGGKVLALAITANTPSPLFPDTPTSGAVGLKDFEAGDWIGILAPAGTPAAVVNRLQGALAKWLALPETEAQLGQVGFVTRPGTPAQFNGLIQSELVKWSKTVKAANIKPE